jgi:NAD(P)-dependent dehydrogenase (short-subunit alcohol dehydrogenase family)
MANIKDLLQLNGQVAIITGGAGLLGVKHAEAILEAGGAPVLLDVNEEGLLKARDILKKHSNKDVLTCVCDITDERQLRDVLDKVVDQYDRLDVLINNASTNPKYETTKKNFLRLETYPLANWLADLNVGLTGSFLCSQIFGNFMAAKNKGVIINIASDLGLIGPNQSLYKQDNIPEDFQPVKPVTYSVVKHGLIGLTRYLATYWADKGIRCNALAPGGVFNDQDKVFLERIQQLIPMRRMANLDEYKAPIVFLASEASSYMTGAILSVDGGRTCW